MRTGSSVAAIMKPVSCRSAGPAPEQEVARPEQQEREHRQRRERDRDAAPGPGPQHGGVRAHQDGVAARRAHGVRRAQARHERTRDRVDLAVEEGDEVRGGNRGEDDAGEGEDS